MGLADRDYMHERRDRDDAPFAPAGSRPSGLASLIIWIAIGCAIYVAADWWKQRKLAVNAPREPHTIAAASPPPRPAARAQPPTAEPRPMAKPQPEAARLVHRCGSGDAVTYTDQPCRVPDSPRVVAAAPQPTPPSHKEPAPSEDSGIVPGTIYECKSYDGATFWAQAHCHRHRALIVRIASVPTNMPFQQQVNLAARRDVAPAPPPPPPVTAQQVPMRAACAALDEEIRQIDERTRQPLSVTERDYLREKRKKARDAQFRIPCT